VKTHGERSVESMERISFLPSYIDMDMRGQEGIYGRERNARKEETDDCLIYISKRDEGTEKMVFVKIIKRVPEIAMGRCPVCGRRVNHLGIPGTPYFQCLACGAVCKEREIVRESIRRWWI